MSTVEMTLDFSSSESDKEMLEELTQVLYNQLDTLDEGDVSRIHEKADVDAKSGEEGKPKSGWLAIAFDALKSNRILQTIIARLQGKQVKFALKHKGKKLEFESKSLSQQEIQNLLESLKDF